MDFIAVFSWMKTPIGSTQLKTALELEEKALTN